MLRKQMSKRHELRLMLQNNIKPLQEKSVSDSHEELINHFIQASLLKEKQTRSSTMWKLSPDTHVCVCKKKKEREHWRK